MDDPASGNGLQTVVAYGGEGELDEHFGYSVSLEQFSGPMDLLLYLVRKLELDVVDIPITAITDQFVAMVAQASDLDLDMAGDFIVMAATLLEIKARSIAPPPEGEPSAEADEPEAFDPRADLIRRLLEYRRFKDVALGLTEREGEHAARCARQFREHVPEDTSAADDVDLGELDVHQLLRSFELVMMRINGLGPRRVVLDEVPIADRMGKLVGTVRDAGAATLSGFLAAEPTLAGKVGTVVALLETVRQRYIRACQLEQYGEVDLRWVSDDERAAVPVMPPEEPPAGRRRRRLPLVTWRSDAPPDETADEPAAADPEAVEAVQETDEQRFLRELDESCDLSAVLARVANIEASFAAHLALIRPPSSEPGQGVVQTVIAPVVDTTPMANKAIGPGAISPVSLVQVMDPLAEVPTTPSAIAPAVLEEMLVAPALSAEALPPAAPTVPADAVLPLAPASDTDPLPDAPTTALAAAQAVPDEQPIVAASGADASALATSVPAVDPDAGTPVAAASDQLPDEDETPSTTPSDERQSTMEAAPTAALEVAPLPEQSVGVAADALDAPESDESPNGQADVAPAAIAESVPAEVALALSAESPANAAVPSSDEVDTAESDAPPSIPADLLGRDVDDDDEVPESEESEPDDDDAEVEPTDELAAVLRALNAADRVEADQASEPPSPPSIADANTGEELVDLSPIARAESVAPSSDPAASAPVVDDRHQPAPAATPEDALPAEILADPPAPESVELVSPAMGSPIASAVPVVDQAPSRPELVVAPVVSPATSDEIAPAEVIADAEVIALAAPVAAVAAVAEVDAPAEQEPAPPPQAISEHADPIAVADVAIAEEPIAPVPAVPVAPALPERAAVTDPDGQPTEGTLIAALLRGPDSANQDDATADQDADAHVETVATIPIAVPLAPATPAPLIQTVADDEVDDAVPEVHVDTAATVPVRLPRPPVAVRPVSAFATLAAVAPAPSAPAQPSPSRPAEIEPMPVLPNRLSLRAVVLVCVANAAIWTAYHWWLGVPRAVLEFAPATAVDRTVAGREPLRWHFNLDMVRPDEVGTVPELTPQITPAIAGTWLWDDQRTLCFTPTQTLPPGTPLIVDFPADAVRARAGFRLEADRRGVVVCTPLLATGARQSGFTADGTYAVDLDFNLPVDPQRVAARLTATYGEKGHQSGGPASSDEDSRKSGSPEDLTLDARALSVVTVVALDADTVRVRLGPAAEAAGRPVTLALRGDGFDRSWQQTLAVGHTLALASASAGSPTRGEPVVRVLANDPMARLGVLARAVTVAPAVPFVASVDGDAIVLRGAFVPGQRYQIAVAAQWPEQHPDQPLTALPAAGSVEVEIPAREPGLWLSADAAAGLAISTVNVDGVAIEVFPTDAAAEAEPLAAHVLDFAREPDATLSAPIPLTTLLASQPLGRYRVRARPLAVGALPVESLVTLGERAATPAEIAAGVVTYAAQRVAGSAPDGVRVRMIAKD